MSSQIKYVYNPDLEFIKPDFKGNIVVDGRFSNTEEKRKPSVWKILKWKFSRNPQAKEKKNSRFKLEIERDLSFLQNNNDVILWLGQSSFYIRLEGVVYITDPILSDLFIQKRKAESPYSIQELGNIDYVLISHVHYDHCDIPTLKLIAKHNPHVEILSPLGATSLLNKKGLKNIKKQEAGWFQKYKTEKNTLCFLPAKHWSRRSLFDLNKVLWGSFSIASEKIKIFFAGDTAEDLELFTEVHNVFQGFDYCLMPIGAYKPSYVMQSEHVSPKEALNVYQVLKGKCFIPMHYATFDLSDEPLGEPIQYLKQEAKRMGIADELSIIPLGKPFYLE